VTGAKCTTEMVEAGGRSFQVSILCKGAPPDVTVDGSALVIGGRRVTCEGDDLRLTTLKPTFAWPSAKGM
jgi:hypothetical protein